MTNLWYPCEVFGPADALDGQVRNSINLTQVINTKIIESMNTDLRQGEVAAATGNRIARAKVLNALGDPIRLGAIDLLSLQDLSPDALAESLGVPANLLAHHLKVLESASVIYRSRSQNDKRRTYVHLVPGALAGLLPDLGQMNVPRVVFVCTHNSARSILAEALWREQSEVPSASAGTQPAECINPRAERVAARAGRVVKGSKPQSIAEVLRSDDLVISVCDSVNEELHSLPNNHLHWSICDPARIGTDAAFRTAMADIRERVTHLAPRITRKHTNRRKSL